MTGNAGESYTLYSVDLELKPGLSQAIPVSRTDSSTCKHYRLDKERKTIAEEREWQKDSEGGGG